MDTIVKPTVIEELVFDVENMLENDIRHFRSMHRVCVPRILPGAIVEGNCGHLYRTEAAILANGAPRCQDCIKDTGALPCPVCKRPLDSPAI